MARKFRGRNDSSDEQYNARRRYYRAAERNLEKAESSSGATAQRYKALAKKNLEDALGTYDPTAPKQKISKPIRELASKMGIDIEGQRSEFIASTKKEREKLIERSELRLESLDNPAIRREMEAYAIFNTPTIARRIIGGFVDVWREKFLDIESGAFDKSKILPALFEHFKVTNLASLLEKVEDIVGDQLYKDLDSDVIYETVKILIQTDIATNSVTA